MQVVNFTPPTRIASAGNGGPPRPPHNPSDGLGLSSAAAKIARVQTLLHGFTHCGKEKEIVAILRDCTREELNAVLTGVDLVQLTNDVDDYPLGPKYKQQMLKLLTLRRRCRPGLRARTHESRGRRPSRASRCR